MKKTQTLNVKIFLLLQILYDDDKYDDDFFIDYERLMIRYQLSQEI
jgi:hypothetical protein